MANSQNNSKVCFFFARPHRSSAVLSRDNDGYTAGLLACRAVTPSQYGANLYTYRIPLALSGRSCPKSRRQSAYSCGTAHDLHAIPFSLCPSAAHRTAAQSTVAGAKLGISAQTDNADARFLPQNARKLPAPLGQSDRKSYLCGLNPTRNRYLVAEKSVSGLT